MTHFYVATIVTVTLVNPRKYVSVFVRRTVIYSSIYSLDDARQSYVI